MPKVRLQDLAEGGFINDRSGKATTKVRKQLAYDEAPKKRGNPTLRKFK